MTDSIPAGGSRDDAPRVRVEYDTREVQFASQFIVSGSAEGILLELSGGTISDDRTGELVLPIQSRIGLTAGGARRLAEMLLRALEQVPGDGTSHSSVHAARLPKLRPH
ncbi:MAG: hypothetical protein EA381_20490 [Planctomycetaceae bacterium]|nr:MAG: hypothetical protein EA381_20490 [Planctomycetaceae bacterium]